jgi:hypothetical protein
LDYIKGVMKLDGTGALPASSPIDNFEIAWSLSHLIQTHIIDSKNPEVQRVLDQLWGAWSPDVGVGGSSYFSVPDIDDTAASFYVLDWAGYPVDLSVFEYYELEDHFFCYQNETDPSLSAHVRFLLALRRSADHPNREHWIQKVINALRRLDHNGSFWWDKWHTSAYYVNSLALEALSGIADDLAYSRLKWILRTQNDDGGWGYMGESTPEETAYCLKALMTWDRTRERIQSEKLDAAAQYLLSHRGVSDAVPLWIDKSLYTPYYPVRAAILSTLLSYLG